MRPMIYESECPGGPCDISVEFLGSYVGALYTCLGKNTANMGNCRNLQHVTS